MLPLDTYFGFENYSKFFFKKIPKLYSNDMKVNNEKYVLKCFFGYDHEHEECSWSAKNSMRCQIVFQLAIKSVNK